LADNSFKSLRDLEKDLPLPRLINGLPPIIGPRDREMIRNNHKSIIIFWSSLFSLYRVLKCSYTLKLQTIVEPFKGDPQSLDDFVQLALRAKVFDSLPGFSA
jgi:hypothetical protein